MESTLQNKSLLKYFLTLVLILSLFFVNGDQKASAASKVAEVISSKVDSFAISRLGQFQHVGTNEYYRTIYFTEYCYLSNTTSTTVSTTPYTYEIRTVYHYTYK